MGKWVNLQGFLWDDTYCMRIKCKELHRFVNRYSSILGVVYKTHFNEAVNYVLPVSKLKAQVG